jgi:hypothetical protein
MLGDLLGLLAGSCSGYCEYRYIVLTTLRRDFNVSLRLLGSTGRIVLQRHFCPETDISSAMEG